MKQVLLNNYGIQSILKREPLAEEKANEVWQRQKKVSCIQRPRNGFHNTSLMQTLAIICPSSDSIVAVCIFMYDLRILGCQSSYNTLLRVA